MAVLGGTRRTPHVDLQFPPFEKARVGGRWQTLLDWVKTMPDRHWDAGSKTWRVFAVTRTFMADLEAADFHVDVTAAGGKIRDLSDVASRVMVRSRDGWIRIYPRLEPYDDVKESLPTFCAWDTRRHCFMASEPDCARSGLVGSSTQTNSRTYSTVSESNVARLAAAPDLIHVEGEARLFAPHRPLFGFQASGVQAVLAGRRLIADEPGLGKTIQAICAHATARTRRLVVVCPPVVVPNWKREIEASGWTIPITQPSDDMPTRGVVVISDSLLAARPHLPVQLGAWADGLIVDEAHRMKNVAAQRTGAVLSLARRIDGLKVALSGTPMVSEPSDLAPILDCVGLLEPVFGGWSEFYSTYMRPDKYRGWVARKRQLPHLGDVLASSCWVRRAKKDVLGLPDVVFTTTTVDVEDKVFRTAHQDVIRQVCDMLEDGDDPYSRSFELISRLRVAAGRAKVKAACHVIGEHVKANPPVDGVYEDPLLVWVHHREVGDDLVDELDKLGVSWRMIRGGSTDSTRIVDEFQSGKVGVLVASMGAVGVGVTLTRGRRCVFVEADWTPATIDQAVDRVRRIGQNRTMWVTTLVGSGTLDERIMEVLEHKRERVDAVDGERSGGSARDAGVLRLLIDGVLGEAQRCLSSGSVPQG